MAGLAALLLVAADWAAAQTAVPAISGNPPRAARVIVKFKHDSAIVRLHALSASASAGETGDRARGRADLLGARHGLRLKAGRMLDAHTQVVISDELDNAELTRRLAADADVEYAVIDQRRHHFLTPNDPLYAKGPTIKGSTGGPDAGQWYLRAPVGEAVSSINASGAWDITTGSANIVVAVLDTGVRPEHPDLSGRLLAGYDMIDDPPTANDGGGRDPDASDPGDWVTSFEANNPASSFYGCTEGDSSWHGTMTSSLVGAASNNGVGMAGLAWGVKLLPVRVLGKCGGYDSDIVAGMQWAAGVAVPGIPANPNPARVINMSLGGSGDCTPVYSDAIAALGSQPNPPVIVAAAGNSDGQAVGSPANCPGVVAVAGLRHIGTKVGFSDLGPEIAISAPAGNCVNADPTQACLYPILAATNTGATTPGASTYTDGFNSSVGTSFSAPLVAGTAALMLSVQSALTPGQVRTLLQATARAFPASGAPDDPQSGPVPQCHAPDAASQLQCYCTTATCGAGMLDAAAAVSAAVNDKPINVSPGWNLLGNSVNASIDVKSALGNAINVAAVWKWDAALAKWAFYTPGQADGGVAYAAARGYEALTAINAGEGFWVNAKQAFALQLPLAAAIPASYFQDSSVLPRKLPSGWSLIAIGESKLPGELNQAIGLSQAASGTIPANLNSLWTWQNSTGKWYFYAPSLAATGGSALSDYVAARGYLDFAANGKTLGAGVGFWVDRP